MNVALEETEEWAQGRLIAKYGDTFLRGNNGMSRAELQPNLYVAATDLLQCCTSPLSRTSKCPKNRRRERRKLIGSEA